MKSNIKRRNEIFKGVIPPKGSEAYERLKTYNENKVQSPEEKKFFKDCFDKAHKSLEAQYYSHIGLITETTLRHFLLEYNTRAWDYGLRSMPFLFNILESFFIFRKPHIYFELIEEENYLISLFDFMNYITSKEIENNRSLMNEYLIEDVIYNFNIGSDLKEISFKSGDNAEFIVSGISMVRRDNEVTVMLITGCNKHKIITNEEIKPAFDNPNKTELLKNFIEETQGKDHKPLFIDSNEEFSKVIVACRIDLETYTIDARYVAEEYEHMFYVKTDEVDGFLNSKGEYLSDDYKSTHKKGIETVELFNAIFDVAKSSLYLPYYLNFHEEELIEEIHETEFKNHVSSPLKKRKYNDTFGSKSFNKSLYVLDVNNKLSPDTIKFRDDLFKIETSGYWKKLEIDEVGLDKNGNTIHGKTWVNKKLSWFEANNEELVVQKTNKEYSGANAGYIYIIRNPVMGKNIFKIGMTRKNVDERINQLSKTSVPDKFYIAQEWNVADCIVAEKKIHELLDNFRVDPRREFFEIDYSEAVKVISKVCNEINQNAA